MKELIEGIWNMPQEELLYILAKDIAIGVIIGAVTAGVIIWRLIRNA
jgi:uncharacterized protein YjeT (DUF2065 family)